ncbi:MAG TPA: pantoate kinase [Methanotrichaceae archaeon]|nr:pantoate kinase [Methanotrichaceae archaeon]
MKAFVPSHITGFFAAKRREDLLKSGSIGCGLCLSLGATTTVQAAEVTEILLNGQASDAPVSRFVVEKMVRSPVRIKTQLDMPLGAGFGASGAGALGAAYALNAYFDMGLTANGAAAVAHAAEVSNRTGLGDVIAQNTGGLVVRLEAGAPGLGVVDRIPVQPLKISYVVRGPISTKEVLSDPKAMQEINRAGEVALKELLKKPTLKEFMLLSRRFTSQIGLASDWALDAIEAVEAAGGMASMIMLGDSVFAIGGGESLKEFGVVGTTTISQRGANLD